MKVFSTNAAVAAAVQYINQPNFRCESNGKITIIGERGEGLALYPTSWGLINSKDVPSLELKEQLERVAVLPPSGTGGNCLKATGFFLLTKRSLYFFECEEAQDKSFARTFLQMSRITHCPRFGEMQIDALRQFCI